MTPEYAVSLGQDALMTAMFVAGPMLFLGLVVGVSISIFQAVTQINEVTLTFIPKIVATMLGLALFAPWMGAKLWTFTQQIFSHLPGVVR